MAQLACAGPQWLLGCLHVRLARAVACWVCLCAALTGVHADSRGAWCVPVNVPNRVGREQVERQVTLSAVCGCIGGCGGKVFVIMCPFFLSCALSLEAYEDANGACGDERSATAAWRLRAGYKACSALVLQAVT